MINLDYLKAKLLPHQYSAHDGEDTPIFFKRVKHGNPNDIHAFTLIIVTLDKYTVTIEGINEILINRAIKAGAITINEPEELDALREVIYDNVLEDVKRFETIFPFLEMQLAALEMHTMKSPEAIKAVDNLKLMVEAANAVE